MISLLSLFGRVGTFSFFKMGHLLRSYRARGSAAIGMHLEIILNRSHCIEPRGLVVQPWGKYRIVARAKVRERKTRRPGHSIVFGFLSCGRPSPQLCGRGQGTGRHPVRPPGGQRPGRAIRGDETQTTPPIPITIIGDPISHCQPRPH